MTSCLLTMTADSSTLSDRMSTKKTEQIFSHFIEIKDNFDSYFP